MMPAGSILLVDDETKILNALIRIARRGSRSRHNGRTHEARRLLGQRFFDVLIVDNLMPDLTGLDLIRELAATPATDRPQVADDRTPRSKARSKR